MDLLRILLQVLVALAIVNVWILRKDKSTPWRGGDAEDMKEEFNNYGLSYRTMLIIGALKVSFAILLLVGIWVQPMANIAASCLIVLMLGATIMHFKIHDPVKKSVPAISVLALSAAVLAL